VDKDMGETKEAGETQMKMVLPEMKRSELKMKLEETSTNN